MAPGHRLFWFVIVLSCLVFGCSLGSGHEESRPQSTTYLLVCRFADSVLDLSLWSDDLFDVITTKMTH